MAKLISARPIAECVWQLTDPFENRAYVVAGRERALLVDTMAGFGDVVAQASELAGGLPVTVVLTHRHCDHVGGSFGAGEVLMSAADDVEAAWEESERGARLFAEVARREGMVPDGEQCAVERGGRPRVSHVGEGDALDLGGRTVDVVELAGHTVGSVGYLVRDAGLLLSGDAVTPVMCLCFAESLTLDAWRQATTACRLARTAWRALRRPPTLPRTIAATSGTTASYRAGRAPSTSCPTASGVRTRPTSAPSSPAACLPHVPAGEGAAGPSELSTLKL